MKIKSIVTLVGVSAMALAFTACDSKQENAREDALEQKADGMENTADQVRKNAEAAADRKEDAADAMKQSGKNAADAVEKSADATRDAAEKKADQIEDAADAVREQK